MKTKTLVLTLIAAALALIAALLITRKLAPRLMQGHTTKSRVAITLGFHPGLVVDLGLLQAIERRDLAGKGFDITLKRYERADLILAALSSGEIQGSLGLPLELLLDRATQGAYPCRGFMVWYFDQTTPYDGMITRADSRLNSNEALEGKTVGAHPSRQVTFFVSRFLPGSPVKPYDPAAPLASLDSGDMAAVYVMEPFLSVAKTNPKYRILETNLISKRIFDGARVPAAMSVLSSEWIDRHPPESAEFVRLARSAYLADIQHRDAQLVVKILTSPKYGLAPEVAAQVVEPASSVPEKLDAAEFMKFLDALRNSGLLVGEVSLAKLLYVPQSAR